MSFRLTIALAMILLVLGGFVYFAQRGRTEPTAPDERIYIWRVDADAIVGVKVEYQDQEVSIIRIEEEWVFDDAERTPVDMQRFGGMAYLLAGPKAERVLVAPADLALYGLDEPQAVVTIMRTDMASIVLEFGDLNVDWTEQFIRRRDQDDPNVYLIHASWTDVVTRLATEPPYIPSAPEEPSTLP